MSYYPTSYSELLTEHPEAVAEIVQILRKSRSKHKNADPATLTWKFNTATKIPGSGTLSNVFAGQMAYAAMTFEEKIEEELKNTTIWVQATMGHWFANSGKLNGVPTCVTDAIEYNHAKGEYEYARHRSKMKAIVKMII